MKRTAPLALLALVASAGMSGRASAQGGAAIPLTLTADRGGGQDVVVSTGVPFTQGVLRDETTVVVRGPHQQEVPRAAQVLARWPADGSIRSVLVAFRATVPSGTTQNWSIGYGGARATATVSLTANPDGPIAATLPSDWYAQGAISGPLLPVARNTRFAAYDAKIERALWQIPWTKFDSTSCGSTMGSRTYYDAPHGMYQLFQRTADARHYRRAREEAVIYRQRELAFYEGRAMATHVCQPRGWTPATPLQWLVLRRMLAQGMLDDYLVTGDPAAAEAVRALGEAIRRNLPALTAGSTPSIEITERNMAWPLFALASAYALDGKPEQLEAMRAVVDRAIRWQARGSSGAFEHDVVRPDPSECGRGPAGASPFMTALLVDGLVGYHTLTGDPRIPEVVRKVAVWYESRALTSDGKAFRYLWNCSTDAYDDSSYADLNLLIAPVFGAAFALTNDPHWLAVGDRAADAGIPAAVLNRPKTWDQATRGFGQYLGRRAAGATP